MTLHLHSLEMPSCLSLSYPSLRALDQSSLSHPEYTGREKGCVRWLEEGGKLPHAAGCSRQAQPRASQSSSCPAPAASAVQGWGSAGSHGRAVPHHRAGSGRLWEPCLAAEVGYDGQWAQPDQRPLARVKLREQQQNQGNACCLAETTSGSNECCPKRCREAGTVTLVFLCPEDSSEEHMGLAEVLHSSAGCDHSEET